MYDNNLILSSIRFDRAYRGLDADGPLRRRRRAHRFTDRNEVEECNALAAMEADERR
jgi:hypothetical protein